MQEDGKASRVQGLHGSLCRPLQGVQEDRGLICTDNARDEKVGKSIGKARCGVLFYWCIASLKARI